MIWKISLLPLTILLIFINQNTVAQEENPLTSNDTTANEIVRSLEILIEQNDEASRNSLINTFIGMMAFLVGLALVIFGLQLSRAEKITPIARKYYRILILALILPVVAIFISSIFLENVKQGHYLAVMTLLMIPAGAVLILMASRKLSERF